MVTSNIRKYSDEEVIHLIDGMENGEIPYNMGELKKLLAEVTNRRLDGIYTQTLTRLMEELITSSREEKASSSFFDRQPEDADAPVRRGAGEGQGSKKEPQKSARKESGDSLDTGSEPYPVLSFLSGLYRVLAWLLLVIFVGIGVFAALTYLKDNTLYMVGAVFAGLCLGMFSILFFYARAERIAWMLDVEEQLRQERR